MNQCRSGCLGIESLIINNPARRNEGMYVREQGGYLFPILGYW